jgi:hypothetical protein
MNNRRLDFGWANVHETYEVFHKVRSTDHFWFARVFIILFMSTPHHKLQVNEFVFKSIVWKKGDKRSGIASVSGWESNLGPLAPESCFAGVSNFGIKKKNLPKLALNSVLERQLFNKIVNFTTIKSIFNGQRSCFKRFSGLPKFS